MDEKTYLKERVADQLAWFEKKSTWNQKRYRRLKATVLVLSVSIPFMVGFITDANAWIQIAIGVAGLIIAIAEGLLSIYKYQDNWIQYRSTAEALKREEYLYKTLSGPYQNISVPFNYFVDRVEGLLNDDSQEWKRYVQKVEG